VADVPLTLEVPPAGFVVAAPGVLFGELPAVGLAEALPVNLLVAEVTPPMLFLSDLTCSAAFAAAVYNLPAILPVVPLAERSPLDEEAPILDPGLEAAPTPYSVFLASKAFYFSRRASFFLSASVPGLRLEGFDSLEGPLSPPPIALVSSFAAGLFVADIGSL